MASFVVIKVKYGDTLRRFNASVDGEQHLDLNMEGLRLKICSLFNLPSNADFSLTYIDEDNDMVTLADDEDLHDVVRQGLNPVRITVDLITDKTVPTCVASGASSTPRESSSTNPQQKFVPSVPEVLNSVPEPLRDAVSKLSTELTSKAALTSPILSDLLDGLSKMGQSYLNASHSDTDTNNIGGQSGHAGGSSGPKQDAANEKIDACIDKGVKHNDIQTSSSVHQSPKSTQTTREAEPKKPSPSCSLSHKGKKANSGLCSHKLSTSKSTKKEEVVIDNSAGRSGFITKNDFDSLNRARLESIDHTIGSLQFGGSSSKSYIPSCPFTEYPFPPLHLPPGPPLFYNTMGPIFHKGVRCDGCGVLPITGPRFKSKVKHDYDLCSICFQQMGINSLDYTRIDFPLRRGHPCATMGPIGPVKYSGKRVHHKGDDSRSRLDSCFIKDVNVLDGTMMAPLTPFTKIWRIRNNGTLTWQRGLQLLWIGGDRFSRFDSIEVELPVNGLNIGEEIDIAVDFVAPELPGQYVSYWRMAEPSGHKFGQRVWVSIQVDASVDLTNESSPKLNLNLHPETPEALGSQSLDDFEPARNDEAGNSGFPSIVEQTEDLNPPINGLHTASIMSNLNHTATLASTSPTCADNGAASQASLLSNPDVTDDANHELPSAPPANSHPIDKNNLDQNQGKTDVEETLLKELEDMGFNQIDVNKKVLRGNNYDLEKSVDDLCGVSEWDPILEDLKEMGFEDKETNKKLLAKNNGSIMRVVMDLITAETPKNMN
ncbi:Protein NBR1-like protein [Bienertia sinuspersici]